MYRSLVAGDTLTTLAGQQLIDPAYPQVADHLWEYAADLFDSGLALAPPLGDRRREHAHG